MNKPTKSYPVEECYDWSDIQEYIEKKYNCRLTDFARAPQPPDAPRQNDVPYQNFWHWLIDACPGIHNGTRFYMPERGAGKEVWQNQILDWIWDEFGDSIDGEEFEMPVWVSW